MSQDSENNPSKPPSNNENKGFTWRSYLLIAFGLGLFILVILYSPGKNGKSITLGEFKTLLQENKVILD